MLRTGPTKFTFFVLTAFLLMASEKAWPQPHVYSPTDARIAEPVANPERGFYKNMNTSFDSFEHLDRDELENLYQNGDKWSNKKISLILRLYYLEKFRDKEKISDDAIGLIKNDLATLRRVGIKSILRFAYDGDTGHINFPNNLDAAPQNAIKHIKQLKSIFFEFRDVIAVIQIGFVGTFGEWYAAHQQYGKPFDTTRPLNENRKQIINNLLESVPEDRSLQLRSYFYKDRYGIKETDADFYRLGFHNDALGGPLDFQGMSYPVIDCQITPLDRFCLEFSKQTKTVPMGGEVGDNSYIDPQKQLNWKTVSREFARNHWSYLDPRKDQNKVKSAWKNHFLEINNRLGYRFLLVSADFKKSVNKGENLKVTVTVKNDGWASPFNKRVLKLVLRPESCQDKYICPEQIPATGLNGDTDPQKWFPVDSLSENLPDVIQPQYSFSGTFKNLPVGNYILSLKLADPVVDEFYGRNLAECEKNTARCFYDIRTIGRFSIRMANKEDKRFKWEVSGLNQLGQVSVVN